MVWERFSSILMVVRRTRSPLMRDGKRQGSGKAATAPISIDRKSLELSPSITIITSGTEMVPQESATSVSPGIESILSGEMGDSESESLGPTLTTSRPRTSSLPKKRGERSAKSGSRSKEAVKPISVKPRKPRKIKLAQRPDHKGSDIPTLKGTEDEKQRTLDCKFEVSLHRGSIDHPLATGTDSSPELAERITSDSEEYQSDLETRFSTPPLSSMDMSGRMGYLKACQKLGVVPCSIFLRQAVEEELKLKYYGLLPKDTKALSMGIRENTYNTSVDLSYNPIGTEGVIYIARSLRENQHLSYLNLSNCFLGRESTGAMSIWSLIKSSDNIHQLNISHNCFRCQDYIWFARILQIRSRLYELDISENDFGPAGVKVFADALAENEILEELKMDWNPLVILGTSAILTGASKNMTLKHLSMVHTGINDATSPKVVQLLMKNDFLQTLDLRQNRLGPRSIRNISAAIDTSKSNIQLLW